MSFKFIPVPKDTIDIKALRSWTVRWSSYDHSSYSTFASLKSEAEVFTSLEDAKTFKKSLEESFKLTKSSCPDIKITEN